MDKHMLAIMIPVLALAFTGLITLSFTPIGRAFAKRLSTHGIVPTELEDRVAQLEGDLDGVRRELAETQERLDFSERALGQLKEGRLPQLPRGEVRQVTPT